MLKSVISGFFYSSLIQIFVSITYCSISINYAHKLHIDVTLLARFICMFVLLTIVNTACFQVRRVLEIITWCQKLFELSKYGRSFTILVALPTYVSNSTKLGLRCDFSSILAITCLICFTIASQAPPCAGA